MRWYIRHNGFMALFAVFNAFIWGVLSPNLFDHLAFVSIIFINLLKLCALPIILTSLVVVIAKLPEVSGLKRITFSSLTFIILSEIIAVLIGLILFNYLNIKVNLDLSNLLKMSNYVPDGNSKFNINDVFNYVFPDNIFVSLEKFQLIPILVFSILVGFASLINKAKAEHFLNLLDSVREIFLTLLKIIMYIAPFAIFVLIGSSVAHSHKSGHLEMDLMGLTKLIVVFLLGLFIHFMWQLISVFILYRKLPIRVFLKEVLPIFITAFVTSSSLATLPVAIEKAHKLGGKRQVVDFMLPVCASMNFSSGMMYEVVTTLFFLNVLGVNLDLYHQILLATFCILTGIAVGGIPETSMVSFVIIFGMFGVPTSIISILLPIDRILDRIRTMVNIFGNTCGTLIVSKFNK